MDPTTGIDLTQKVPADTANLLTASQIILISSVAVLMFIFFKRYRSRVVPLLGGIVSYLIFIVLVYNMVRTFFYSIPGFENGYENNQIMFNAFFLLINTGLFLLARIFVGKFLLDSYDRQGDVLNMGLGISLGETLIYLMTTISLGVWAGGINSTGMQELFKDVSQKDIASAYDSISVLFTAPSVLWLLLAVSAILDMLLSCALMVVVYGVIKKKIPAYWYFLSWIIQFAVLLPFKIYDNTSYNSVVTFFVLKLVLLTGALCLIYKIDCKYIGGIITYIDKSNRFTKMPKFGKLRKK